MCVMISCFYQTLYLWKVDPENSPRHLLLLLQSTPMSNMQFITDRENKFILIVIESVQFVEQYFII